MAMTLYKVLNYLKKLNNKTAMIDPKNPSTVGSSL